MKPLTKSSAAIAISAALLLTGGSSMALANDTSAANNTPAVHQIHLDFPGTQVSDRAGAPTRSGLPFLPGLSTFATSGPITAADGSGQWRELTLNHCGNPTEFFIPESAVLADETAESPGYTGLGFGLQDAESISWAQETFTSVATLKEHAGLYGSASLLTTPVFYSGASAPVMPVGEPFADAFGEKWYQVLAPMGVKTLMVSADDVLSVEPLESANCGEAEVAGHAEENIEAAARDAAVYSKIKAAAVAAVEERQEVSK